MASKTLLFLLAFILLVCTKAMSTEEDIYTESNRHRHAKAPAPAPGHSHAHSHSPKKAPSHPPKRSPAHPPKVSPTHAPQHAPSYAPITAPTYPPTHPNHGNCVELCADYCKKGKQPRRPCVKACVPCCDVTKCVPGHNKKCANWGQVYYHGKPVKCP